MKIVIKEKLKTWNETINSNRSNRFMAASQKKKEMETVKKYLSNVKKITEYPININCYWHIKNSNSDLDNRSLKSVLDVMQKEGILENDNCKHINKITYYYVKDDEDYLEMEINKI